MLDWADHFSAFNYMFNTCLSYNTRKVKGLARIKTFRKMVSIDTPSAEEWLKQVDNEANDNQQQREEWQCNINQFHDVRPHMRIVDIGRRTLLNCLQLQQLISPMTNRTSIKQILQRPLFKQCSLQNIHQLTDIS